MCIDGRNEDGGGVEEERGRWKRGFKSTICGRVGGEHIFLKITG